MNGGEGECEVSSDAVNHEVRWWAWVEAGTAELQPQSHASFRCTAGSLRRCLDDKCLTPWEIWPQLRPASVAALGGEMITRSREAMD